MKFEITYCSQCGGDFGPGDSGFSRCEDHQYEREGAIKRAKAMKVIEARMAQVQKENAAIYARWSKVKTGV